MNVESNNDFESSSLRSETQFGWLKEEIASFAWDQTPLGPIGCWPDGLVMAFRIMLNAAQPACIFWGEAFLFLCNIPAQRGLGIVDPACLGQPAGQVLSEIWQTIEPQVHYVLQGGGGQYLQDQFFRLQRAGVSEETWWDYSLNPVHCADGMIGGVLCFLSERTEQVIRSEGRLQEALDAANGFLFDHNIPLDEHYYIDPDWFALLGFRKDELPSGSDLISWIFRQLHPEDVNRVKTVFKDLMESRMEGYLLEVRLRHKLGHWVWVKADAKVKGRDRDGNACRLIGLMTQITARKAFERSLRKKEQSFRIASQAAELGVFLGDPVLGAAQWENEKIYEIFGVRPKDGPFSTEDFYDKVLLAEDRALFDQTMVDAIKNDELFQVTVRIRRQSDGQRRWIKISGQFDDVEHVGSSRLLGVVEDITARMQDEIERELIKAERTAVMENMLDAVVLADPDGRIIYHNPASLALHGYANLTDALLPESTLIHQWELRNLDGEQLSVADWPMVRALRGEEINDYCVSAINLDTRKSFIGSYNGRLVRDSEGAPLFALLTIRDITEKIRVESALENERQLLQAIYETIPVMLSIYDPRIQEVVLNQHFYEVTGWTEDDISRTNVMALVYPDPEQRRVVAEYMQSLSPGFKDIPMTGKDGRRVESSWANVQIPDGRQVGIGLDITERKRNERKLRQLSERLQFLHKVDEAIITSHSSKQVAEAVVEHIPVLLPSCVRAGVTLFDANLNSDAITTLAAYRREGAEAGVVSQILKEMPVEEILGVLRRGKPYAAPNLAKLSSTASIIEGLESDGICALVFYPVFIAGHLAGTLNIGMDEPGTPTDEQWDIISELVTQLAIGLENAQLYEKILERNQQLLETIVENLPIAVALVRQPDDEIILTNPTYRRMVPEDRAASVHLAEHWENLKFDLSALCRQVTETGKIRLC